MVNIVARCIIETPLGPMVAEAVDEGISRCEFFEGVMEESGGDSPYFSTLRSELTEYFTGKRKEFTVALAPSGTIFQKEVWTVLLSIPYGVMWSYRDQARALGNSKAVRAVASANGRNPVAILIPCHRVIGADGSLTGYSGGLWRKKQLLAIEAQMQSE